MTHLPHNTNRSSTIAGQQDTANSVGGFAGFRGTRACNFSIGLGAAVAIKLPGVANFLDFVEVQVGDEQFVLIAAGLGDDFPARITKIAFAVKLANLPGMLGANAVDSRDEIRVGNGMGGLLELPKVFGKSSNGGGRVVDN